MYFDALFSSVKISKTYLGHMLLCIKGKKGCNSFCWIPNYFTIYFTKFTTYLLFHEGES